MRVVITFVHGTRLGKRSGNYDYSGWSNLKATLATLGDVKFRYANWSGQNSHSVRAETAVDLTKMLSDALDKAPSAAHYVIAHSHGGNIAAIATSDASCRDRREFRGTICLATPFLYVPSDATPAFPKVAATGWVSAIPIAVYLLYHFLDLQLISALVIAVVALGAVGVLFIGAWMNAGQVAKELRLSSFNKLWVIKHSMDEALFALTSFSAFAWVYRRYSSKIRHMEETVAQHSQALTRTVFSAAVLVFVMSRLRDAAPWLKEPIRIVGYFLISTLAISAASAIVIGLITASFAAICMCVFGIQLGMAVPFIWITSEGFPEDDLKGYKVLHPTKVTTMQHFETYKDPAALASIRSFIETDLAEYKSGK